jgi:hypothetical protein
MTLSESYPTREAYESGLFNPSFARSQWLRCCDEHTPDDIDSDSEWDESRESRTSPGHTSCEFRDFCNHMYTVEFTCDCEVAWKKRAGLALPASA